MEDSEEKIEKKDSIIQTLACPNCSRSYKTPKTLKQHMKKKHPGTPRVKVKCDNQFSICSYCGKTGNFILDRHVSDTCRVYNKDKLMECEHCFGKFLKLFIYEHMYGSSNRPGCREKQNKRPMKEAKSFVKVSCGICGKLVDTSYLNRHKKLHGRDKVTVMKKQSSAEIKPNSRPSVIQHTSDLLWSTENKKEGIETKENFLYLEDLFSKEPNSPGCYAIVTDKNNEERSGRADEGERGNYAIDLKAYDEIAYDEMVREASEQPPGIQTIVRTPFISDTNQGKPEQPCDLNITAGHKTKTKKIKRIKKFFKLCSDCGKSFTSSIFSTHRRTHKGEKPNGCGYCTFSCSDMSNLKKHYRVHTGEKPYKCTKCTRGFTSQQNVNKHLRAHT